MLKNPNDSSIRPIQFSNGHIITTVLYECRAWINLLAWLFVVTVTPESSWGQDVQWTSLGPFGGEVKIIVRDPQNPQLIYTGTGGGIFKSEDGGVTWSFRSEGLGSRLYVNALAVDPASPTTIYANVSVARSGDGRGDARLYKSVDGARSWRLTGFWEIPVDALAVNYADPNTIYAAGGGFWKSSDAGDSWILADTSIIQNVATIALDPADPDGIYLGTKFGPLRSVDAGSTWILLNEQAIRFHRIYDIWVSPRNPSTLYIGDGFYGEAGGGVFRSDDRGQTWRRLVEGLSDTSIFALEGSFSDTSTLYCGTFTGGIFKSETGGYNWFDINTNLEAKFVRTISVSPLDDRHILIGRGWRLWHSEQLGVFRSTDGGQNWAFSSQGMTAVDVSALVLSPVDSILFVGSPTGGVYRTPDAGGTWEWLGQGLPSNRISDLVIHPMSPDTLFCVTLGKIYKSVDGGDSWFLAHTGFSDSRVQTLAIDPTDPQVLYAGCETTSYFGQRDVLYKTTDGGATWIQMARGIPISDHGTSVIDIAVDPRAPQNVYAAVDYNLGEGIFKSSDGGEHWRQLIETILFYFPNFRGGISVHPVRPNDIYGFGLRGVLKTMNAGDTWQRMNEGLTDTVIYSFAIDPRASDVVYCGATGVVFWSDNGGEQWEALKELPSKTPVTVLEVSKSTGELYAGTSNGLFVLDTGTLVVDEPNVPLIPLEILIWQNYPNPFNSGSLIRYTLSRQGLVTVRILDLLGGEVVVLRNEVQPSGEHSIRWDGRDSERKEVSSGIYFCQITQGSISRVIKMLLLR